MPKCKVPQVNCLPINNWHNFVLCHSRCQREYRGGSTARSAFILLASRRRGSTLLFTIAGKSQNLFGCKNRSMRSRLFSYYQGYSLLCDDITQNARGRERFSYKSRGRRGIVYGCSIWRFANRWPGAKTSIKSSFMEIDSVFCALNRSDAPGKNSSVRSKLPTLACRSGRKVGKVRSKPALRE